MNKISHNPTERPTSKRPSQRIPGFYYRPDGSSFTGDVAAYEALSRTRPAKKGRRTRKCKTKHAV